MGTYRLLLGSRARGNIGFYSEYEFDLHRIKRLDGGLLELGRTCARKDFRDQALIPLMWGTIAEYVREHRVRYIFGCGSLYTTESSEANSYFAMLRKKYYAPEAYRVFPVPARVFPGHSPGDPGIQQPRAFSALAQLAQRIPPGGRMGLWSAGSRRRIWHKGFFHAARYQPA